MSDEKQEVVVVDVRMPFWSIVVLMVKLAIAAIPALLILFMIGSVVVAVLGSMFGGAWYNWHGRIM